MKKIALFVAAIFLLSSVSAIDTAKDSTPSEPKEKDFKSLIQKSGRKMRAELELKIPGKALGLISFDTMDKEKGAMLSDIYAYYLTGANFKLLDRKELDKVLEEIQLSFEMVTEKKNMDKIGKQTGADFLQAGNMTQFEDSYYINVKVVDVSTGESIYADSLSFKNRDFMSVKNINDLIPERKYPVSALFRSALIPGWGQFYNDKPVKGGIFLGLHVALAATTITFACLHWDDNSNSEDPKVQQKALDEGNRNKYVFAGAVSALGVNLIISMIDAYVDAKRSK
jgi:curli biogenesis system outer membrane secretion channel CsgG